MLYPLMNSSNKQIAKNTLILYLRMFFVMIISLYTVRIVIKTLGIIDYGIFNAVGGIVLIMSFFTQTITFASQRFFSFELGKKKEKDLRTLFNSIQLIYFCIAIVIVAIAEILGLWLLDNKMIIPLERMGAAHWIFHFSLLSFVISIMSAPYNAIIIVHGNMKIYAYIGIIEVLLKLGIIYLLLDDFDKLILYGILTFVVTAIISLTYIGYCYFQYPETHFCCSFSKKTLKNILKYSSWTLLGSMSAAATNQGISILLNIFFGPTANAAQTVGRQVGNALQLFSMNIFTAVRAPMTKAYAEGDYAYVTRLFYKSSKYAFFLLLILMLPLMFETRFILCIWLGNVSEYMVQFTRLTLIYIVLVAISNPITIIMQAANKVKQYHTIVDGFSLSSLVLSYFLFASGAPAPTVYWVMIFVVIIAHILRMWLLHRAIIYSIREYIYNFIFPSVIIVSLSVLPIVTIYSSLDSGWGRFLVLIFASLIVSSLLIILLGIEKQDKVLLKESLFRLKNISKRKYLFGL